VPLFFTQAASVPRTALERERMGSTSRRLDGLPLLREGEPTPATSPLTRLADPGCGARAPSRVRRFDESPGTVGFPHVRPRSAFRERARVPDPASSILCGDLADAVEAGLGRPSRCGGDARDLIAFGAPRNGRRSSSRAFVVGA
jgi:hypothetical protein